MIHYERPLGASWSTDRKAVGLVPFPLDPAPVQSEDMSLRTGHVDTRTKFKVPEANISPAHQAHRASTCTSALSHVLTREQHTRVHFCPQHWLLCHLGLY